MRIKNVEIISSHEHCENKLCPCKNMTDKQFFTSNFAPYTCFAEIKETMLLRAHIRIYLRVCFINYISFKLQCQKCNRSVYKNDNICCENAIIFQNMIIGALVEDSSGTADADIISLENARELLDLTPEIEDDLLEIASNREEIFLKFKDFPESLQNHMKNLKPILKFCIVKMENKTQVSKRNGLKNFSKGCATDNLVMLNSASHNVNARIKVLKVLCD